MTHYSNSLVYLQSSLLVYVDLLAPMIIVSPLTMKWCFTSKNFAISSMI